MKCTRKLWVLHCQWQVTHLSLLQSPLRELLLLALENISTPSPLLPAPESMSAEGPPFSPLLQRAPWPVLRNFLSLLQTPPYLSILPTLLQRPPLLMSLLSLLQRAPLLSLLQRPPLLMTLLQRPPLLRKLWSRAIPSWKSLWEKFLKIWIGQVCWISLF